MDSRRSSKSKHVRCCMDDEAIFASTTSKWSSFSQWTCWVVGSTCSSHTSVSDHAQETSHAWCSQIYWTWLVACAYPQDASSRFAYPFYSVMQKNVAWTSVARLLESALAHSVVQKEFAVWSFNYRGIHLTPVLAKLAEHVIGEPLLRYFQDHNIYGTHQWAYRKFRSSRDLITLLTCSWILAFIRGYCIGAFAADISGAFDRVFLPYLAQKLRMYGISQPYLGFLVAFLASRHGYVCVNGCKSDAMTLEHQVFQGTCFGPPLWNVFFSDVVNAIANPSSIKCFADDLNAFHQYSRHEDSEVIFSDLQNTQSKLHAWGKRNRVEFDAGKESFNILHPFRGQGADFRLLGIIFDCKLHMDSAVQAIVNKARPKVVALMKTRPYYTDAQMIIQFKTHILGILESNIGGIYHATATVLQAIDRLFGTFVNNLSLSHEEAFLLFNLAPLKLRRDIAMLAFLHKLFLPDAHAHIQELFPRVGEQRMFWDRCSFERHNTYPELHKRSLFHLTRVYNALPQTIRDHNTILDFQQHLTHIARVKCSKFDEDWQTFLSPRDFTGNLSFAR